MKDVFCRRAFGQEGGGLSEKARLYFLLFGFLCIFRNGSFIFSFLCFFGKGLFCPFASFVFLSNFIHVFLLLPFFVLSEKAHSYFPLFA